MSNDVDDQLRRAMAALDRQVPDDYFDTLAERTLARLDDGARLAAVPAATGGDAPRDGDDAEPSGQPIALSVLTAPDGSPEPDRQALPAASRAIASPSATAVAHDELGARRRRRTGLVWLTAASAAVAAAATVMVLVRGSEPAMPERLGSLPQVTLVPPEPDLPLVPEEPPAPAPAPADRPSRVAEASRGKLGPQPAGTREPRPNTHDPGDPSGGSAGAPLGYLPGSAGSAAGSAGPGGNKVASAGSLSDDEIERSMAAVVPAARACLAGSPGAARVRLTVAPSGRVTQVVVQGERAGTPAGACLARALTAALFRAWDGEPRQFDYAIPE